MAGQWIQADITGAREELTKVDRALRATYWADSVKAERPGWCAQMRAFIFRSKGGA